MNETVDLNQRQKIILNIVSQEGNMSRQAISLALKNIYPVSKATLARDLKILSSQRLIGSTGTGPSWRYQPVGHPLLHIIDLGLYFQQEPDDRLGVKTSFQSDIFKKLTGLFNADEKQGLGSVFRSFSQTKKNLDRTIMVRELERFLIELSWKSSKIEGNTYTLLETEALIKEQREASGRSRQETRMILNHKEAFKLILDNTGDFKIVKLNTLLELHNVLVGGLDIGGGIRKNAVGITGTRYRPLDNEWQIREMLGKLLETVNRANYPLEKALVVNSMIAYLQPFSGGNKRTARMFANAILMAYDYFPLSYRSVDENEYKQAMILFYETNNLYHLKRLFLEQYRFALATYFG
jgi:Fic family protein